MANLTSQLLVRLIDGVSGPARKAAGALLGIGNAARGVNGLQSRLTAAIEKNDRALDKARGRLIDAGLAAYGVAKALGAPIRAAMSFESAMADVAKVSGFSDAGIEAFGKQLRKLAVNEIPMSVDQLAALSAAAAQAGVPDAELFDFTKMTAKVAVAWEMTGSQAGEALAKIKSQLQLTTAQTGLFADAINHLSDNSAASAADLVEYAKRVSAQGEFFGYSKEATLAFGSALIGAGAPAEVAATSFRNMGRALTKGASATKAQRKAFKALGLDAEKVQKAMQKNAVGTTLEVIDRLGKLPRHLQASTMSDLFGDEARALAPILDKPEILRDALKLVADEQTYANSVGREFERRAQTSEYALQRFKSQLNDVALSIGGALLPAFREVMSALGPFVIKFSEFAEAHPALIRNLVLATSALFSFRVALAGLRFLGLFAKGGALSLLALGFNTVGKAAIAAKSAIGGTIAMQTALAGGKAYGGFAKFIDSAKALVRVVPGLRLVGPAVSAIAGGLGAITAPVAAGIAAVAVAGYLIYKYWDRIASFVSGFASAIGKELAPALEYARPLLDWLAPLGEWIAKGWEAAKSALSAFGEWIGSFFGREVLNDEQKQEWENAGREAATAMIEAIKSVFSGLLDWVGGIATQIGSRLKSGFTSGIGYIRDKAAGAWNYATGDSAPAISGARAKGGPIWPGGAFLVGEEGPEIITPSRHGFVHPNGSGIGGAGGSGVTINQTFAPVFNGITDTDAIMRKMGHHLSEATKEALRGVQADFNFKFT